MSDLPSLGGGCVGAAAVWEGASRVTNGSALVCSSVGYFPNRAALCKFLLFFSSLWVCSLFVLFAYHLFVAAAPDCRIICQSASSSVCEWVSHVSWLSGVLSRDGREGLCLSCVRCCHDKPMLMSQGSVWHPGMLLHCHFLPWQTLTDRTSFLFLSAGLTTFWDVND